MQAGPASEPWVAGGECHSFRSSRNKVGDAADVARRSASARQQAEALCDRAGEERAGLPWLSVEPGVTGPSPEPLSPPPFSSEFTPSCFSLRCSALRSMPTNWAVRLILPPNRSSCACRYCVSNRSRASRSGRPMMSAVGSMFSSAGALEPISGGSMSARIGSARCPAP